jgi:hypothetical protein
MGYERKCGHSGAVFNPARFHMVGMAHSVMCWIQDIPSQMNRKRYILRYHIKLACIVFILNRIALTTG